MPGSSNGSAPTPPSAPSSAPEPRDRAGDPGAVGGDAGASGGGPAPRRGRGALLAVLGAAALASAWNPVGAPFATLAGVLVALIAARRALAGDGRRLAALALALGTGAAVAGVLVLLGTLGLGLRPEQKLQLETRTPADATRLLDEAEARTRDARGRARRELDELRPAEGAPVGAGLPQPRPTSPPPSKR